MEQVLAECEHLCAAAWYDGTGARTEARRACEGEKECTCEGEKG